MFVTNKQGQVKLLKRAASNNRMQRHRPEAMFKNNAIVLLNYEDKDDFAKFYGDFGRTWGE